MDIISSKDNVNIKLYQKLGSNKKYRKEYGMFILEGIRLCLDAINENAVLHCVFVTVTAEKKYSEAVNFLRDKAAERLLVISDELGERLADTSGTQGVFAICKILDKRNLNGTICSSGKYIVLNNLQDPGNVGTIIRTADAVGISGVILCDCCDIYSPKVIRSTMGSLFRLAIIDGYTVDEVFDELNCKNIATFAAVIDTDAISLTDCDFSNGAAVVIGNEGSGLAQGVVNLCENKLTIKMQGNVNSLNAAMATSIIMWEMMR